MKTKQLIGCCRLFLVFMKGYAVIRKGNWPRKFLRLFIYSYTQRKVILSSPFRL